MLAVTFALAIHSSAYAGGLTDSMHPEEDLRWSAFGGVATGMSMAGQGPSRLKTRSPMYLSAGATVVFSQLSWLRFDASLLFEFEKRIGFGLAPRLRARLLYGPRYSVSAGVALPVFVSPYTLLGVSTFARAQIKVLPRVHLFAEPTVTAYVAGTDLVKGQGLLKMDLLLGVNLPF